MTLIINYLSIGPLDYCGLVPRALRFNTAATIHCHPSDMQGYRCPTVEPQREFVSIASCQIVIGTSRDLGELKNINQQRLSGFEQAQYEGRSLIIDFVSHRPPTIRLSQQRHILLHLTPSV